MARIVLFAPKGLGKTMIAHNIANQTVISRGGDYADTGAIRIDHLLG